MKKNKSMIETPTKLSEKMKKQIEEAISN